MDRARTVCYLIPIEPKTIHSNNCKQLETMSFLLLKMKLDRGVKNKQKTKEGDDEQWARSGDPLMQTSPFTPSDTKLSLSPSHTAFPEEVSPLLNDSRYQSIQDLHLINLPRSATKMGPRSLLKSNVPEPIPSLLQQPINHVISGPSVYSRILKSFDFLMDPTIEAQKFTEKPNTQSLPSQKQSIASSPFVSAPPNFQKTNPNETQGQNPILENPSATQVPIRALTSQISPSEEAISLHVPLMNLPSSLPKTSLNSTSKTSQSQVIEPCKQEFSSQSTPSSLKKFTPKPSTSPNPSPSLNSSQQSTQTKTSLETQVRNNKRNLAHPDEEIPLKKRAIVQRPIVAYSRALSHTGDIEEEGEKLIDMMKKRDSQKVIKVEKQELKKDISSDQLSKAGNKSSSTQKSLFASEVAEVAGPNLPPRQI